MMESMSKHFPHYISLIGIFIAGILGFYFFSYDRFFQTAIVIALALSYVSWGIIHHAIHKDIVSLWSMLQFQFLVLLLH